MSKLHKRSVQEALNATVGGEWTVNSAGTAGSSASTGNISPTPLSPTSLYMIPPFFLWSIVSVEVLNINAASVSVAVAEVFITNSAFVPS